MKRSRWLATTALASVGVLAAVATVVHADSTPSVHAYRSEGVVVATVAELAVKQGQTTAFDTFIVNDADHPVRVLSAKVATVPGQREPQLTHIALVQGHNFVGVQNWPPIDVQLVPLTYLPPGRSDVAVGIAGNQPGNYLAAGVTLTLRDGSQTFHATAWGGGVACVVADYSSKRQLAGCRKASVAATDRVTNYIHQQ